MFRQVLKLYARHYRATVRPMGPHVQLGLLGLVSAAAPPLTINPGLADQYSQQRFQQMPQNPMALRISWNDFCYKMLAKGEVEKVIVRPGAQIVEVILYDGAIIDGRRIFMRHYFLQVPSIDMFEKKLRDFEKSIGISSGNSVPVVYERNDRMTLGSLAFIAMSCFLIYKIFSKGKKGGLSLDPTNMFSKMKKAKYTLVDPSTRSGDASSIRFKDVAGLKEAKVEVMEFVDYLKNSERFLKLGAKLPKGVLLTGPPGCGKTLLAKAVATEANVPFMAIAGSDFVEMIGGIGAARVRSLFKSARKLAPCIIYIDEIDSIGKKRAGSANFGNTEMEQTLNQLLIEMDGMVSRTGIILLASTNRAEVLDQALTRAGRFDRQIYIDLPNLIERREIFERHSSKIKLDKDPFAYSLKIAQLTPGMSGADLANVCNEAALYAARKNKFIVDGEDLDYAIERVVGGTEKTSSSVSAEEKKMIAYHECGRALVSWLLEHSDMPLKVSIVPRTKQMLGSTVTIPSDQKLYSKEQVFDRMCAALGGRVAELLKFNHLSSGAQDDLRKVTKLALDQIKIYGFDEIIGHISFPPEDPSEPGVKPYSKHLANVIDHRAGLLVAKAFQSTQKLLSQNMDKLETLTQALLKKEVIYTKDIQDLIGPRPYARQQTNDLLNTK